MGREGLLRRRRSTGRVESSVGHGSVRLDWTRGRVLGGVLVGVVVGLIAVLPVEAL